MDEKRLWAAVLIQAIKDLAGFTLIDNARAGQDFKTSRAPGLLLITMSSARTSVSATSSAFLPHGFGAG
jgi:hypothetical protein